MTPAELIPAELIPDPCRALRGEAGIVVALSSLGERLDSS